MNDTPAFPINNMNTGMTLRDYFAARVLQEIIHEGFDLDETADRAYSYADAMMAARGETK